MTSSLETTSTSSWSSSSESLPPSDPTDEEPSPSEDPTPATPASSSPSSTIAYEHRVFVTGPTDSGKSYLARELLLSAAAPRLIVDPSDSSLLGAIPGVVTFNDPARVPEGATVRFVPDDPGDRDAYDTLYRWAFAHGPMYVLLDEAGVAAPATGSPPAVRTLIIQGRKRMIGHVACHTRPREVDKNLIAQARHVIIFGCVDPEDRKHLAGQMGCPVEVLADQLTQLAPRQFLWWNQGTRTLTRCAKLEGNRDGARAIR